MPTINGSNGSTPLHFPVTRAADHTQPRNAPPIAHGGNTGCMAGFKNIPRRLAQAVAGLCRGRQTHAPQSAAIHAGTLDAPRRSSERQRLDATLASTSQQSENIQLLAITTLEETPFSKEIVGVAQTLSTGAASVKDEVIANGSPKRLSAQSTPPDDSKGATVGAADNRRASTTSILSKRNSGLRIPQAQEDKGKVKTDPKAAPTPPEPSTPAAHQEPSGGVKETPEANDARDPLHRALDTGIDKVAKSLDSFADNYLEQIDDFGDNLKSAGNEMRGALDRYGNSLDRVEKSLVDLNQQLKDAAQSLKRGNEEMKARFQAAKNKPVEMTPERQKAAESTKAFIAEQKALQERLLARQRNRQQPPATPDASTSNRTSATEPKPKDSEKPATPPTE